MNQQTTVRRGKWKLVLHGQLVEGAPPDDDVHLSDLEVDPGERRNLTDEYPDLTRELTSAATAWRDAIEERWQREWRPRSSGTTSAG
jgi:hypothetical protein